MGQLDTNYINKGIYYLKTAIALFSGVGSPEGVEDGEKGCLYVNEVNGSLYQKTTAKGTLTGWSVVGGGGGGSSITVGTTTISGGVDGQLAYQKAGGTFGEIAGATSDGTSLFVSALNLQADQPTFLNALAFVKNSIGASNSDGINIVTTTAAAAGAQQWSPGFRQTGYGWKTSAGGASQAMDVLLQLQTVQGTTVPTANYVMSFQSNGTGYTNRFTFGNTGNLTVDQNLIAAGVASSIYTSALANSTYLQLTSGASGAGVTLAVAGGGTNENLALYGKGSGGIGVNKASSLTAQLDVLSNSSTRPAARFQAASGTASAQEMLGFYDGSGNNVGKVSANGTMRFQQGFQVTNTSDQIKAEVSIPSTGYFNTSDITFNWSSSTTSNAPSDLTLARDAANTLAQRNGANAQTLRIYNTHTDASNYERLNLGWVSNEFQFINANAGTGTIRSMAFVSAPSASTTSRIVTLRNSGLTDLGGITVGGSQVQTNLGTAPSANITDATLQYTADVVAADANNFIRNEAGYISQLSGQLMTLDQDFNSISATLANVTGGGLYGSLTRNVQATKPYNFHACLFITADSTGGWKIALGGTATASAFISEVTYASSGFSPTSNRVSAFGGTVSQTGLTTYTVHIYGYISVNTAGTLTIQFAQSTANGTSTVKQGSYFECWLSNQ